MSQEGSASIVEGLGGGFLGVLLGSVYLWDKIRDMPGATVKLCAQAQGLAQTWANEVGNQVVHDLPYVWDLLLRCRIDRGSIPGWQEAAGGFFFAAMAIAESVVSGEPNRRLTKLDIAIRGFRGACAMGSIHWARILGAGVDVALDPTMWKGIDQPMLGLEMVVAAGLLAMGTWPAIKLLAMGGQHVLGRIQGGARIEEAEAEPVEEIQEEPAVLPKPDRPVYIPIEVLVEQSRAERRKESEHLAELEVKFPGGIDQMVELIMINTSEEFNLIRRTLGIKEHG